MFMPHPRALRRAALYIRYPEHLPCSAEYQELSGRCYVERLGGEVQQVFTDIKSRELPRTFPGLAAAQVYCTTGAVDALVVVNSDRIFRRPEQLEYLHAICDVGVALLSVCEGNLTPLITLHLLEFFHAHHALGGI